MESFIVEAKEKGKAAACDAVVTVATHYLGALDDC